MAKFNKPFSNVLEFLHQNLFSAQVALSFSNLNELTKKSLIYLHLYYKHIKLLS